MADGLANGAEAEARQDQVEFGPLPAYLGYLLRRAQGRVFADFADELGDEITPSEFGLLTMIAHNPGITQVRLAAAVSLDKSTLSPALARLTGRGLIVRKPLPSDRRLQALFLAPGAQATLNAYRARVEAHERRIALPLSESERLELMRLLRRISGA